jgi:hypothetical protein
MDNASTDGVSEVAKELAAGDERVRVLHLDRKGRGVLRRAMWVKAARQTCLLPGNASASVLLTTVHDWTG